MIRLLIISFIFFITTSFDIEESVWIIQTGQIHFRSEAPLEVIEATSKELKGVIDTKNRTFAFTIDVKSFNGFNNLLQQTHFYENYGLHYINRGIVSHNNALIFPSNKLPENRV